MKDNRKTKDQLVAEIQALQKRISDLEKTDLLRERSEKELKESMARISAESIKLGEDRLKALLKLTSMLSAPEREIADFALEQVIRLTKSKGGYLHFFSEDEKTIQLYTWSKEVLKICTASKNHKYPLESAGVWADSLRFRKPVLHNDYQSMPDRKGYPEGHFKVMRHLGVPIYDGTKIVGVSGVGNKEEPYDETDATQMSLFMNSMWGMLKRRRSEEEIDKLRRQQELILDSAGEGILGLDTEGRHTFANPSALHMLGYEAHELIGRRSHPTWHHTRADGGHYPEKECPIYEVLRTGVVNRRRNEVFWRKNGTSFPVSYTSTPIMEGGNILGAVVTFLDISDSMFLEEELKRLATTDRLTGAFNRTKMDTVIPREIELVERYGQQLSVIMFDIDFFKEVNDRYGHAAGDYVLKTIADIVHQNVRKIDYFVRWGGEEFMILSSETGLERAQGLAERLRKTIEDHEFDNVGRLTISFGVTEFRKGDTEDSLIRRVDDAMYLAKKKGRNRVEIAG